MFVKDESSPVRAPLKVNAKTHSIMGTEMIDHTNVGNHRNVDALILGMMRKRHHVLQNYP